MIAIFKFPGGNKFKMCCDFCAVAEFEDGVKLVASPNGTHICQNCIKICAEVSEQEGWEMHSQDEESTP